MKFFLKIRLSFYFWIYLAIFMTLAFTIPVVKFDSSALTLFSVNSFLYGFYIAPILSTQKVRIEELQKVIRAEANAIFTLLIKTKKLSGELRSEYQEMFENYLRKSVKEKRPGEGEKEYELIISKMLNYKGKEEAVVDKLLDGVVANQTNRSLLAMQLRNKVFSNEWWVMIVLFSITLSFIIFIDIGAGWQLRIVKALLCTGLSMLITILVKLSTLTHKKARQLWRPFEKLLETRFYQID